MASKSRIQISNSLFDVNQPASVKVLRRGDKFQLCITIGLLASNVPETGQVTPQIKDTFTEATVEAEILMPGAQGNIKLKKNGTDTKAPQLTVVFTGPIDGKIPGTGDKSLKLLDISEFDSQLKTLEPVEP